MTDKKVDQKTSLRRPAHRWHGHADRRHLQHLPLHQLSQNVGPGGVTGVAAAFVCVAGGVILIVLGVLPKMAALVESLPTVVLGGAGLVMFGMVAATGIRIPSNVDFQHNRNNAMIVAVSIGVGMIPLVAQLPPVDAAFHPPADRIRHPAVPLPPWR